MNLKKAFFLLLGVVFLSQTSPVVGRQHVTFQCPKPSEFKWTLGQNLQWGVKTKEGWTGSTATTGKPPQYPQLTSLVDTRVFGAGWGQFALSCSYYVENSSLEDKITNVYFLANNYYSCITENNKINNNTFICTN